MRRGHVAPHSCALTQSSHKNTEWPSFTDGEVEPQGAQVGGLGPHGSWALGPGMPGSRALSWLL